MEIEEIKVLIQSYVDEPIINFKINRVLFDEENGRSNLTKPSETMLKENLVFMFGLKLPQIQ